MLDEFKPATFDTCFANSDQQKVMHVLHYRPGASRKNPRNVPKRPLFMNTYYPDQLIPEGQ